MELYFPCVKIPYRFVTPLWPLWLSKLRLCQRFSVKMIITLLLRFVFASFRRYDWSWSALKRSIFFRCPSFLSSGLYCTLLVERKILDHSGQRPKTSKKTSSGSAVTDPRPDLLLQKDLLYLRYLRALTKRHSLPPTAVYSNFFCD